MDNSREKLVGLLESINAYAEENLGFDKASGGELIDFRGAEYIADHLLANGVTVQEWIPVSERLPEVGADVLAFGYWNEMWQPLKLHYNIRFKGQWFTSVAGQLVYYVTHWMPLPTPPKGA